MKYSVYILESETNGSYYIGCTKNLDRRVKQHNSGLSNYTRSKRPWKLMYREELETLSEARKREKQIKGWKKRAAIEKLIQAPIV